MSDKDFRIGDAERDEVTARLADHYAAGRLTRPELDERTVQALGARTRGDLESVTVDLPDVAPSTPASTTVDTAGNTATGQSAAISMWRRKTLAPWAVFGVFFIFLWAVTGAGYFWPMWPIMGWGIAVAMSAISAHTKPELFRGGQRQEIGDGSTTGPDGKH